MIKNILRKIQEVRTSQQIYTGASIINGYGEAGMVTTNK